VRVGDDGRVESFTGRTDNPDSPLWHYIGVQVVEAHVFADLPDNEPAESVGGIYKDLLKRGLVHAHRSDAVFRVIGRPEDYIDTTLAVASEEGNATGVVIEAGAAVDPGARLDRVIVWSGSRIDAGARLTNCIVADAHVPAGTRAENSCLVAADNAMAIVPFP
jgi:NDP-sugar pyrophosphorylase family protein